MATAVARDEGSIPVAACTTRHASLDAGGFRVSDVTFAPDRRLPRHSHPHGCIAVVAEGAVDKAFARVFGTASQGAVITMPPEEPHVDTFGRTGARLVVVESPADEDVALERDWACLLIATKIARELEAPDSLTPLAVEGLALELAAAARRLHRSLHNGWRARGRWPSSSPRSRKSQPSSTSTRASWSVGSTSATVPQSASTSEGEAGLSSLPLVAFAVSPRRSHPTSV